MKKFISGGPEGITVEEVKDAEQKPVPKKVYYGDGKTGEIHTNTRILTSAEKEQRAKDGLAKLAKAREDLRNS